MTFEPIPDGEMPQVLAAVVSDRDTLADLIDDGVTRQVEVHASYRRDRLEELNEQELVALAEELCTRIDDLEMLVSGQECAVEFRDIESDRLTRMIDFRERTLAETARRCAHAKALATQWATQLVYDDVTAQQMSDGRMIFAILDGQLAVIDRD